VPAEQRGRRRVAAGAKRNGEIRTTRKRDEKPAGKRITCAEGVGPVDGLHVRPHDLSAGGGECAGAAELDADNAIPLRELKSRLIRLEPGQRPGLLGICKQETGRRRRLQEAVDAERRDEAGRRYVEREEARARALERRARSGLRPRLKERVARDEDSARLEGRRQIDRRKPGAGAWIGDDRVSAHDDDAACRRFDVAREQWLDAGLGKSLRDQPSGGVRADTTDDRGACAEQPRRERRVGSGPARTQLDATVDAIAGDRCRKRPVEHHVTNGDQVIRHAQRMLRSKLAV
jgi:hypothetical protein